MGAEQPRTENQGDGPQNGGKDCYISKIPNEILLSIFKLNANMEEEELRLDDFERVYPSYLELLGPARRRPKRRHIKIDETVRAITTTRNSSQVNTAWRDLILSTSAIWANLIDILFLDYVGDYFREEVIRRTQNAPLHVKGRIHVESRSGTGPWLTSFLNHNWQRIRHFDVRVCDRETEFGTFIEYANSAVYREILSCLSRPAPALESFTIDFQAPCDPLAEGSVLFGDSAPQLRLFQTKRMILAIDKCSWLPQLQEFRVFKCYSPPFSSVGAFYNILSQMTNLEFLSLENAIGSPQIAPECPQIRLPRLRKLQIREDDRQIDNNSRVEDDGSICWPLLSTITPNAGCSLEIFLNATNPNDLNIRLVSRWASNYFDTHRHTASESLDFGFNNQRFWFRDRNLTSHEPFACHELGPFFCLRLTYHGPNAKESVFYRLLQALSSLSFPHLTSLTVFLPKEYALRSFSDPEIAPFYFSLPSVTTFNTTPSTLRAIVSLPSDQEKLLLFPLLQCLRIYFYNRPSEYESGVTSKEALDVILTFLDTRHPQISSFIYEASFDGASEFLDNLSPLDKYTGLRIKWYTREFGSDTYICGSGKPETLDLAKNLAEFKTDLRLWRILNSENLDRGFPW